MKLWNKIIRFQILRPQKKILQNHLTLKNKKLLFKRI